MDEDEAVRKDQFANDLLELLEEYTAWVTKNADQLLSPISIPGFIAWLKSVREQKS